MGAGAIALSFGLVYVDVLLSAGLNRDTNWFLTFGPEGARAILGAISGAMITVAGLTFSITMLTLQLASSQFGPRLLHSFLRDRGNQVVLGTFISTFLYCLLVLRAVRGTEEASFVPHLSVATGVLFAVASLGVLIYFIHHTAHAIRLETILAGLARETSETIRRLYPPEASQAPQPAPMVLPDFDRGGRPVPAKGAGYVQIVDHDMLMKQAERHQLVLRLDAPPGSFVMEGEPVLTAWPRERATDEASAEVGAAIVVGNERTPRQDLDFSLRRIVEIGQRALSPGLNDPTTACYCIDRLREALIDLARHERPSRLHADSSGQVRLVTGAAVPGTAARSAFAALARYGIGDADVVRRLLAAIHDVAEELEPAGRAALEKLAGKVRDEAAGVAAGFDRE